MNARLTLLSHSSTRATSEARIADDEPLDDRGATWAADARGSVRRADIVLCSPALSCQQTAEALGLTTVIDQLLADWNLGRWRGQTLDDIVATDPAGVSAWLSEPAAAPHGGEPLTAVLARAARWLGNLSGDGHTVAVTHSAVVRGAVIAALGAPAESFWRIDIAPLTATILRGSGGRWTLRSTGNSLRQRGPATKDGS